MYFYSSTVKTVCWRYRSGIEKYLPRVCNQIKYTNLMLTIILIMAMYRYYRKIPIDILKEMCRILQSNRLEIVKNNYRKYEIMSNKYMHSLKKAK